jgi:hypothetical protein
MQKRRFSWRLVKWFTLGCLALHSIYCVFVFVYVHLHQDAGDALYWLGFIGNFDAPLAPIGFSLDSQVFHFTRPLTDWWYAKGYSGMSMRAGQIFFLFGGLQWTINGFLLGCAVAGIRAFRMRRLQEKIA